ncbi:ABC transporter substrate-binding protein [Cereibacter changlensis JA139]|uniref:ABC transporter substrate-binding protein n=2 Tax=Cereibacter changlensis TaxID=402884 RepID=A0A2T4JQW0_9RHOB|nr:ABC transporter substrate-binding protein [Cereibacter changlensis]PTE20321.1 ABC transporter substrate-binding protein [Cereibacter changlensis JA139]PZX50042.1 iron complex transport system substrate-binding protein [Cereibacter changlensis]
MVAGLALSRRQVVAGAAAVLWGGAARAASRGAATDRIVALDWALAETLVALGVAPLAVAEAPLYARRVVEPALPAGTRDIGLRSWPNLEALRALQPDLILAMAGYGIAPARLERIAPVRAFPLYSEARRPLDLARQAVRDLGGLTGRGAQAAELLDRLDAALAGPRLDDRPLLIVKFADDRLLDVFGAGSLFHDVLRPLGATNAWTGPTNAWGFASTGLEALAGHPEARLVIIEPAPPPRLADSPLWRALPQVRAGRVTLLPPVWVFGGVPSALRFARLLGAA